MAGKKRAGKIITSALKLLITILIIAFLIDRLGWRTIVDTVRGADAWWLAASVAVFLVSVALGTVQWRLLLANRGLSLPFARTLKLYFMGMFFNNFIAGGIVGDAVKIASIHSRDGAGRVGFAATALDRFAGLWALCGFAVIGSVILLNRGMLTHGRIATAVIALFAAFALFAGIMLFLVCKPLQRFVFTVVDRFTFLRRLNITGIIAELLIEARDYRLLASVAGIAALTQFLRIASNILVAVSLGLVTAENFQYFFIFVPILGMVMTIPLPFGVREMFGGALFALAGFPRDAAIVMGFLASIVAITVSSLGGVFFVTEKMHRPAE